MSSRVGQVKNRAPAPIQISAEQIIREAADRQERHVVEPVVKIHDAEEYQSHLRDRRKHFEDNIRYRREHMGNWVKYARFEEEQSELERARSIFERALEVDHRSSELWLRYAEFEMRHEFVNHARNVLDRAVQILPRQDFLWYKYVYMEEMVGDVPKCRAVFDRWMEWMPDDNAWLSYARFETRCGGGGTSGETNYKYERAEAVMRRYVNAYPCARSFLRFAKWAEFEAKRVDLARTIFEAALGELEPEEIKQARVFKQFASFEDRQQEYERARVIYRHAIALLRLGAGSSGTNAGGEEDEEELSEYEKKKRDELYKAYIAFEKKHGDQQGIENVILTKQRAEYQKRLALDPTDYDGWFELAKLEEEHGNQGNDDTKAAAAAAVRETYERAVSNVPASQNKEDWKRYIYLWIYYAVYEELTNRDLPRASQIYETCLQIIPHERFTFAKIWVYAAKLYVRRKDLTAARKLLGKALGMCGGKKESIFVEYINLELSLGEVDRCRSLYTNYLKAMPHNCKAWTKYAQLEQSVGETDRCRAIYELAISQSALDMPEMLWKAYIDFEMDEGRGDLARNLYTRLLERTGHVKVWISFAQFEGTAIGGGVDAARQVFTKAYAQLKQAGLGEERILLLDAWRVFEKQKGDAERVKAVEAKMPRRIKRKRMREDETTGAQLGWEEYFDYQFPDDDDQGDGTAGNNFKILEMAAKWKEQQRANADDDSDSMDSDDDEDDDEE